MGYLQQNVTVHGFYTVENIGEEFRHSVEFMGHAGKSVNTILRKELRGRWFGNTVMQEVQFSNQRSSMTILLCHSRMFLCFCCLSAPPVVSRLLSCCWFCCARCYTAAVARED